MRRRHDRSMTGPTATASIQTAVSPARPINRGPLILLALAGLAACGGDDTCGGSKLSDDQLCKLQCKVSTKADAQAALGTPEISVSDSLAWSTICPGTQSVLRIQLVFSGPGGTISAAIRSATGQFASGKLPDCLSACAF